MTSYYYQTQNKSKTITEDGSTNASHSVRQVHIRNTHANVAEARIQGLDVSTFTGSALGSKPAQAPGTNFNTSTNTWQSAGQSQIHNQFEDAVAVRLEGTLALAGNLGSGPNQAENPGHRVHNQFKSAQKPQLVNAIAVSGNIANDALPFLEKFLAPNAQGK